MQPKVSIVIPVYNVEKYLDRCVQSVLSQTLQDFEIILVDDGSPDNCPAMCDAYAKSYNRITVVHKANAGLGMACNSGIEVAKGKYIAFLDSDDWVDSDMYQTMYDAAENQKADIVFSGLRRVDENGNTHVMNQADTYRIYSDFSEIQSLALDMIASKPEIRQERRIAMSAKVVLYNMSIFHKYHVRFESERQFISEDLLLNLDFLSHSNIAIELPMTFYNYFVNNSSLTSNPRNDRFEKYLILRKELIRRYFPDDPEWSQRINRMFIGYVRQTINNTINCQQISQQEKNNRLKQICNHGIWKYLNKNYQINKMPIVHKLIFVAIANRYIWMLKLIFLLNKN